jgi:Skp family chaperone for outer membrane proteins
MKTIKTIAVVIVVGVIGCYTAIRAQDETPQLPPSTESPTETPPPKSPPSTKSPSPAITEAIPVSQSLKIAVVNLVEVFGKYQKTKDYEKLLEKKKQKEELTIQEIKAETRKLQEELSLLSPTSELHREKSERLNILNSTLKYKIETWNEIIKKMVNEQTLILYKDIRDVIDNYARENGYTFIFKTDPTLPPSSDSDEVTQQISIRTVLYAPKTMDITEDIIKILNKGK